MRSKGLFGYIQPDGQWALEPRFEQASSFCGGVAKVKMQGSWYFDQSARKNNRTRI
ncbi:MAG: WG repeat-containing protein [Bacteroidota bacterium]|nr:MAG: WG repeat-containing protein [Bacteroidota bacterium]